MRIIWNEERIDSNTELGENSEFKWTKIDQSVNKGQGDSRRTSSDSSQRIKSFI